MFRTQNIFVDSNIKYEFSEVMFVLSEKLVIEWKPLDDPYHLLLDGDKDTKFRLLAGTHSLVNDGSLDFENYRFQIEVWCRGVSTWDDYYRELTEFCGQVFQVLKETNNFRLLWTNDIQHETDRFIPVEAGDA